MNQTSPRAAVERRMDQGSCHWCERRTSPWRRSPADDRHGKRRVTSRRVAKLSYARLMEGRDGLIVDVMVTLGSIVAAVLPRQPSA
ncbi:hypothetical protein [Nannocystis sp. SCPEA4]|uniref:hypothetical protein n=1 Tax=Nannocystis sp. SCPEA4 TaxID=2996787 RepID=UPI00226F84A6|nr:hypothetical protein [Nannocystis sp. SCPEA4]MCY1054825.1 hypothetical protein [Nannocystis sp. SCPEA4]